MSVVSRCYELLALAHRQMSAISGSSSSDDAKMLLTPAEAVEMLEVDLIADTGDISAFVAIVELDQAKARPMLKTTAG